MHRPRVQVKSKKSMPKPKARIDESLGMRRGKESGKKQSYKDRRDESKGASKKDPKYSKKAEKKIASVMREGYAGKLHSGSRKGPIVTKPSQMKAIALSEARRAGDKVPKRKSK